jgi:16S rRNA (guanine527-N7)-methyltransferase
MKMFSSKDLKEGAQRLGVQLSEEQLTQICQFCLHLLDVNQRTNLIADCEGDVLLRDHILDALALVPICSQECTSKADNVRFIDIGSGGGLPGLILAIANPFWQVVLVEATGKKASFLSEAVLALNLQDRVLVLNRRCEELAQQIDYRQQFDYVTARAVGRLAIVMELTMPFLKVGGLALIQKSAAQCRQEVDAATRAASILQSRHKRTVFFDSDVLGKERGVLVFEQSKIMPSRYPRTWSKLVKAPLF